MAAATGFTSLQPPTEDSMEMSSPANPAHTSPDDDIEIDFDFEGIDAVGNEDVMAYDDDIELNERKSTTPDAVMHDDAPVQRTQAPEAEMQDNEDLIDYSDDELIDYAAEDDFDAPQPPAALPQQASAPEITLEDREPTAEPEKADEEIMREPQTAVDEEIQEVTVPEQQTAVNHNIQEEIAQEQQTAVNEQIQEEIAPEPQTTVLEDFPDENVAGSQPQVAVDEQVDDDLESQTSMPAHPAGDVEGIAVEPQVSTAAGDTGLAEEQVTEAGPGQLDGSAEDIFGIEEAEKATAHAIEDGSVEDIFDNADEETSAPEPAAESAEEPFALDQTEGAPTHTPTDGVAVHKEVTPDATVADDFAKAATPQQDVLEPRRASEIDPAQTSEESQDRPSGHKPALLKTSSLPAAAGTPETPTDTGLHPVILMYKGYSWPLFKSKGQPEGLLKDDNLASTSMADLISKVKTRLASKFRDDGFNSDYKDVELEFEYLTLKLSEAGPDTMLVSAEWVPLLTMNQNWVSSFSASLNDVLDVYKQLYTNQRIYPVPALRVRLTLEETFASRLTMLKRWADDGQGINSLAEEEYDEDDDPEGYEYDEDIDNHGPTQGGPYPQSYGGRFGSGYGYGYEGGHQDGNQGGYQGVHQGGYSGANGGGQDDYEGANGYDNWDGYQEQGEPNGFDDGHQWDAQFEHNDQPEVDDQGFPITDADYSNPDNNGEDDQEAQEDFGQYDEQHDEQHDEHGQVHGDESHGYDDRADMPSNGPNEEQLAQDEQITNDSYDQDQAAVYAEDPTGEQLLQDQQILGETFEEPPTGEPHPEGPSDPTPTPTPANDEGTITQQPTVANGEAGEAEKQEPEAVADSTSATSEKADHSASVSEPEKPGEITGNVSEGEVATSERPSQASSATLRAQPAVDIAGLVPDSKLDLDDETWLLTDDEQDKKAAATKAPATTAPTFVPVDDDLIDYDVDEEDEATEPSAKRPLEEDSAEHPDLKKVKSGDS